MTDVTGRQFTVTAIDGDNISVVCYDDGASYLCSPLCFEGEQSMFIADELPVEVGDVAAERAPVPIVSHPLPDANTRIDDGVTAALTTVVAAAGAIHAIPHGGAVPARFEALLIQAAIISDAFIAMLQAQAASMVPPAPPPP